MQILFINSFINSDYNALRIKLCIIGLLWVFVFIALISDLVSGYRKARQRGEARTSYGLKRTISKFALYYTGMLFAFMFDALLILTLNAFDLKFALPLVSIIVCGFLLYVEFTSILEKAEDKEKARLNKSFEDVGIMLKYKDDFVQLFEALKARKGNDQ